MGLGWASDIYPYIKSEQVFQCPDDTYKVPAGNPGKVVFSYYYNNDIAGTVIASGVGIQSVPLPAFTAPTQTVICWEMTQAYGDPTNMTDTGSPVHNGNDIRGGAPVAGMFDNIDNPACGIDPSTPTRHLEGSNFLAADGHVKFLLPSQISAGRLNSSATGTQEAYPAHNPPIAEGAGYAGAGKHALTFSSK